jgi:hypothetical protein
MKGHMGHGHSGTPLPASVDLRDICMPQSQAGSTCYSVATSGGVWAAQNKQAGRITERPSARFLFWASGERSVGAIVHAISARGGLGVVPASLWDWVKNPDGTNATTDDGRAAVDPDATPPADVIAFGAQHLAVVDDVQRNIDAIKRVLASGLPVLYNGNGVHAALVVGYDETTFLIMDSRPIHPVDVDPRGYFWRCAFQAFLDGSKDCYVVRSVA